jgi:hypothetical protein
VFIGNGARQFMVKNYSTEPMVNVPATIIAPEHI